MKSTRKCLDFIGSALLCCFIMPMYLFVSNYPQFGLVDTLLIVTTFLGIFVKEWNEEYKDKKTRKINILRF